MSKVIQIKNNSNDLKSISATFVYWIDDLPNAGDKFAGDPFLDVDAINKLATYCPQEKDITDLVEVVDQKLLSEGRDG